MTLSMRSVVTLVMIVMPVGMWERPTRCLLLIWLTMEGVSHQGDVTFSNFTGTFGPTSTRIDQESPLTCGSAAPHEVSLLLSPFSARGQRRYLPMLRK